MDKRTLGRTGLEVTQLGYGAMEIRGPKVWSGREVTDEQSETILHAVLDAGINFIDTAVDYGESERRIGQFISSRRNEYYLATKCGCDPHDEGDHWETPHTWTRENLLRNIAGSIERMKTDHVDLLQLHNPSPEAVRDGDLVSVLQSIQAQGLTRFIGISTMLPELTEFVEWGVFDTFQIPYSCLDPVHYDALTLAADSGAGVIIRGGIARGGPEGAQTYADTVNVFGKAGLDELLEEGMTPADLLLRHTLSHPACHTTIVGTLNPAHLADNLIAANQPPVPADLYNEVRERVAVALAG